MARSVGVDPRIGTELAGYRIEAPLGRGGMGVVYLAEQLRLRRKVALKLVAPDLAGDERFRERLLRESELAASIDHPNVLPIYDAAEAEELLYVAMRYVEGTDLRELLAQGGKLEPERAISICERVAEALDAAHAHGLVHRDVKPGNVLIASEGHVYLADFGLTRAVSEPGALEQSHFAGSAAYAAPEQIEGEPVDGRADQYALGCVLYECLIGKPPFRRDSLLATLWAHLDGEPPSATRWNPALTKEIDAVFARGLGKKPDDRYASCRELVADARRALGLLPAPPEPLYRRREVLLAAGGLAAAALAAVLLLTLTGGEQGPTTAPTTDIEVASIQRIDPETNELEATIRLGPALARASPTGRELAVGKEAVWVVSRDGRTYSRIDPSANAVTAAGSAGGAPSAVAAGPDSVLVANGDAATPGTGTLTEIEAGSATVRRTIPVPFTQRSTVLVGAPLVFNDVAVTNAAVWLTSGTGVAVKRLTPGGTIAGEVATGLAPNWIAASEAGIWVTRVGAVLRIGSGGDAVAQTVLLRFSPLGIATGAGRVWVTNGPGDSVSAIDPATSEVTRTIAVGDEPAGIAVGAGSVWVANRRDGTVSRIEPASGVVIATIDVGGRPHAIGVGAGGVWVTVHPAPGAGDEALAEMSYGVTVLEISERAGRLSADLWQPIVRTVQIGRGFEEAVASDAELIRHVIVYYEDAIADLEAIRPPDRFASDHERYLAGLAEQVALYRRLAEAVERRDAEEFETAWEGLPSLRNELRLELSIEFQQFVGA